MKNMFYISMKSCIQPETNMCLYNVFKFRSIYLILIHLHFYNNIYNDQKRVSCRRHSSMQSRPHPHCSETWDDIEIALQGANVPSGSGVFVLLRRRMARKDNDN